MDIDPRKSVVDFFKVIFRRADGLLLVILIVAFVTFAVYPNMTLIVHLAPKRMSELEARLAYIVMPFALLGEYIWFFTSIAKSRHSLLLCIILLITASIPFIRS